MCVCVQAEGDRLPPGHTVSQLETCKIRSIRAGTLERLVETLLTASGDNDLTYTSIFLSTYRAFASTQTVLQLLLDRWGRSEAPRRCIRPDSFFSVVLNSSSSPLQVRQPGANRARRRKMQRL